MISKFEWKIARRYLRAKRSDGFTSLVAIFSVLGIFLGLTALIMVSSLMNGFREDLRQQLVGAHPDIEIVRKDGALISNDDTIFAALQNTPGIQSSFGIARDQAVLSSLSGHSDVVTVKGLSQEDFDGRTTVQRNWSEGDKGDFTGWSLVVSNDTAARMGVRAGDSIDLISPLGNVSPMGWTPRVKRVFIAGVVEFSRDQSIAFMPKSKAQIFFRQKGQSKSVEVFIDPSQDLKDIASQLKIRLATAYTVETWMDLNATLVSALDIERLVVILVLSLIVLVAAFSIISSQVMLVRSKSKGIAVLRTMGATRKNIATAFLLAGLWLGGIGSLAGLAVGSALAIGFQPIIWQIEQLFAGSSLAYELAYLAEMRVDYFLSQALGFTAFSLILTLLATMYPAWSASKIEPADALRSL